MNRLSALYNFRPVQLPPGREAFELFAAMDVPGEPDLVRRLDLLGVR